MSGNPLYLNYLNLFKKLSLKSPLYPIDIQLIHQLLITLFSFIKKTSMRIVTGYTFFLDVFILLYVLKYLCISPRILILFEISNSPCPNEF